MDINTAYDISKMSVEEFHEFVEKRPDYECWELIYGIPFCLESPSSRHQKLLTNLATKFDSYFANIGYETVIRPFNIILFKDTDFPIICQPDLLVYNNKNQNDGRQLNGTPDLVVEIWSESNSIKYINNRMNIFKKAGVKEIWEVYQDIRLVKITSLIDDEYMESTYPFEVIVSSKLFDRLQYYFK